MKECPKCGSKYGDNNSNYCIDCGSRLFDEQNNRIISLLEKITNKP